MRRGAGGRVASVKQKKGRAVSECGDGRETRGGGEENERENKTAGSEVMRVTGMARRENGRRRKKQMLR